MKSRPLRIVLGALALTAVLSLAYTDVRAQVHIPVQMPVQASVQAEIPAPLDPSAPEIHILRDGKATAQGLKVVQRANTSLFVRMTWDDGSFMRWTVKTASSTDIRKRFGDSMAISDIAEGDYLYIEGKIESGSSLSMNAKKIIDWSDMTAQSSFSGTVKNITIPSRQFSLLRENTETAEVFLNATTTVYRNKRELPANLIRVGDNISSIEGVYDHRLHTILAQKIKIQVDSTLFQPQNYQGILQSVPSGTPTTFMLRINGKDYTVVLSGTALILNNAREKVTFERFLSGDIVRVYGNIREDSDLLDTINASIVRNINF